MRIETSSGPAEIDLTGTARATFLLALTHGAAGEADTQDLLAVRDCALELRGSVALIRQPFRVRGGRAPGSAAKQDAAWVELIAALRERVGRVPLIQGGRSNGARVACRTASQVQAAGVVALAFPLHPPGKPEKTRIDELRMAPNVVVVNGSRDPFGIPDPADAAPGQSLDVHIIEGQAHSFRAGFSDIADAVRPWLRKWSR